MVSQPKLFNHLVTIRIQSYLRDRHRADLKLGSGTSFSFGAGWGCGGGCCFGGLRGGGFSDLSSAPPHTADVVYTELF